MGLVNFVTPSHILSKRNYLARMNSDKPECMRIAKQFDHRYWDGDRKYGYGGYRYDGRWQFVASKIAQHYGLIDGKSHILDIGCGKAHLLAELAKYNFIVEGCDISEYALDNAAIDYLVNNNCKDLHDISDGSFDLVYSINVFHNLGYKDLKQAIHELVRVTKPDGNSYICVESYRNEEELTNLQAWQLTCLSYYTPDDWCQIFEDNGYKGDYEYIYFE